MLQSYRLKKGDIIAVVAPSSGKAYEFPRLFKEGLENIEKIFGLKVKEYPTTKMCSEELSKRPDLRAKDINDAFADSSVKGVFTTIGGDDSIRILPFLDKQIIKKNPKLFMGYSDATVLLVNLNQMGLITFHGPSIMAGFAQAKYLPDTFKDHIETILFNEIDSYNYKPYEHFCDGYKDWSGKGAKGEINDLKKNKGWNWINGSGQTSGKLFGGCIEALEFLKGTKYWPTEKFWDNKVLFLETSEEKPSISQVKYMLRNYGMQGVFKKISALFFGRANFYTDREKSELEKMIIEIVIGEFGAKSMPIITNMDFGHTDPQLILPLGLEVLINTDKKTIKLNAMG
ncbi:LD-carboxypeptidase [Patescibacteria group bacterium]|nr:LD-carboxypeptidase [Patescibacteria group bacterium]